MYSQADTAAFERNEPVIWKTVKNQGGKRVWGFLNK